MSDLTKKENRSNLKITAYIFFALAAINVVTVVLQLMDSSTLAGYDQSVVNLSIGLVVGYTALSVLAKLYIGIKGLAISQGKQVKSKAVIRLTMVLGSISLIIAVVAFATGNVSSEEQVADFLAQLASSSCYFYFAQYALRSIED